MDGILNIYKEQGYTSHDVVARLRGILHTKKIGHTGTLDPAAEGVLPVCIGRATGLCELLTDKTKTYETVLLLGTATDTQDITGTVQSRIPVTASQEQVREAILSFEGTYEQIPPMYSAKKVGGQKLYELAREGRTIERKAVSVTISDIEILWMRLPEVRFRVTCTKGTYIRTLCADIGEKLGCGACMKELLRTRSGNFMLEQALRLEQVEKYRDEGRLEEFLLPLEAPFTEFPRLFATETGDKWLMNGNPLPESAIRWENAPLRSAPIRVCNSAGTFIGIYRFRADKQLYWPEKLFLRK